MRIWNGYGSEHSMNLVLIGRFETVAGAQAAEERMEALQALAEAAWSDDDWRSPEERMPRELGEALSQMKLYDMGRSDVDAFALDHNVTREAQTVRIWTDESDVQGFLKVLLHHGAKVEVFSRHTWDEEAVTRSDATDASNSRSDGGSD
ncbi:DUF6375 family protein [Streptomyces griseorubiginosus]|uniref:DUF6375 family protein n=1 Tax=Streptomyces griseorubiginosus TaxID=67304 RepID=UPI002E7FD853|nr:DUF6375 family protein [Streptomyces griseorubiginosus]WUB42622.1 DUF6375 family protein [Streptomyces griseorubiginosus]WUB51140.1 DUF6375 family protein [Streptomyces griseorubiginosus]